MRYISKRIDQSLNIHSKYSESKRRLNKKLEMELGIFRILCEYGIYMTYNLY